MLKMISNAGLALLMTVGSLSYTATPAFSQGVELRLGDDVIIGRRDRERLRDDEEVDRRPRRGCDPEDALDAARDEGLRRARVVGITPRRVIVEGMTRRGPDRMTFANVRGCPEL